MPEMARSRPPASPEAPPAVRGTIRALAHGHHLAGAEGLPQEYGEGALDVQDGGGPLWERACAGRWRASPSWVAEPTGRAGVGWAGSQASRPLCSRKQGYTLTDPTRAWQGSERVEQDERQEDHSPSPSPVTRAQQSRHWVLGPTGRRMPHVKGQLPLTHQSTARQECGQAYSFLRKVSNLDFYVKSLHLKILNFLKVW